MNFICKNKKIKKLLDKDNADKAISYLKKLISQQKNIVLNSLILSQVYLIRHNLKAAIDTVESLVSSNINIIDKELQFEVYKLLGDYYHKKEDYRSAFLNYQLALAIKRDDTLLLQKMALIYLGMNNYEKAENIFTYLAKIEPDNISIKCNIAYLYIESHRFTEAEVILKDLLEKNRVRIVLFYYAYFCYAKKDYENAIKYFQETSFDNGLNFKSNYYSGKSAFFINDFKSAVNFFEEAKKSIDFDNELTVDLYYTLALCYDELKQYEKSYTELKKVFNLKSEYKDVKERLLSEKYKNITNSILNNYNNSSVLEFCSLCCSIVKKISFKIHDCLNIDKNTLIVLASPKKAINDARILKRCCTFDKKDKVLFIFSRNMNLTVELLQDIEDKYCENIDKKLLLSSYDVSGIIIDYLKNKKINFFSHFDLSDFILELKV